jgi:plastocyanin/uncharacterized coiled-coil protein SlyX
LQLRSISRVWLVCAMFALTVGISGGAWEAGTSAQSEPSATPLATPSGTPPSVEDLKAQVAAQQATIEVLETQIAQVQQLAEQQATIEALETQVAQIQERVNELSSPSPASTPEVTPALEPTPTSEPAPTPSPTPEPTATPEPDADRDGVLEIGETWAGDDWEVTVTGYELSPTIESDYDEHVARGVFAIVYLTVVNAGNEPAAFPYEDLRLTTSEGRTYTPDHDSMFTLIYSILEMGSEYDELQPGLSYPTGVAFDIPPDATDLSLTTGDEVFVFTLGTPATEPVESPMASPPTVNKEVTVIAIDIDFEQEEMRIPADTDVTVILDNQGVLPHNWVVDELEVGTETIPGGETTSIVVNAPAGEYEYYCSVPGHKEAGMVGMLIVEEEESAEDRPGGTGGDAYAEGDSVVPTETISLRPDPSTSGEPIAVLNAGDTLTINGGPEEGETYIWWEVATEDGTTGWVVEDFIELRE